MSQEQASIQCKECDRRTLHARKKCSHLIHALVTLFLCGLWFPVWLVADYLASKSNWRCQTCGAQPAFEESSGLGIAIKVFAFLVLAAILIYVLADRGILPKEW